MAKKEEKKSLQAKFLEDTNPRRSWLNHFCKALGYVTALVALIIGVLEVCGFFWLKMTIIENILSVYLILFCILIVLTELNLFNVAKESKILNLWALRGLFYVFVGVLGLNAINTAVMVQGAELERGLFQKLLVVFSAIMIGIGMLYVILGLLCVQMINDKMETDYQDRKKRSADIKRTANDYGALGGVGGGGGGESNVV